MIRRDFSEWSYAFDAGITLRKTVPMFATHKIVDVIAALTDYGNYRPFGQS
jgi:hypothetical protein